MTYQGPFVLGIDAGTQGVRAALFDLTGEVTSLAAEPYPIYYPQSGWAEQDILEIWQATVKAVNHCLRQAAVPKERIVGVCCDGTSSTVIPVKYDGTPLRRAILWMDGRAVKEAEDIAATGHPVLKYTGGTDSVEWMAPKALWLKRNETEIYDNAGLIIESADWLTHQLTGRWTASICNATCKWNYLKRSGGWDRSFFQQIGLEELLAKWPQDVLDLSERVGSLTPQAAEALGLPAGIAVAQGGIDAHIGMIGMNVITPGRMAVILGTSVVHLVLAEQPLYDPGIWGPYPDAVLPDLWLLEGGQISAGSLINWYKDYFGGNAVRIAEKSGESVYQVIDSQAARIGPGAEGLVVLDHWQGNRTPWRDPLSRGVIAGLSFSHTPAHILRGIYEGISFGTRHILENFSRSGSGVSEIYACGGGTKSRLWLNIMSSVCGIPITLTDTTESVCLGGAICAAVAADCFCDIGEACRRMVKVKEVVEPDLSVKEAYDFYYRQYLQVYAGLKETLHELALANLKGGDFRG